MGAGRALNGLPRTIAPLCTLFALLAMSPAGGERSGVPVPQRAGQAPRDLEAFHTMINQYRSGSDEPVDVLAGWSLQRFYEMQRVIETPVDDYRPWERARFEVGAMLHADTALRLLDGRDTDAAFGHLDLGSRLLFRGGAHVRPFASAWHVALSRILRHRLETWMAERLLEMARDRLPDDSAVLFESSTLAELQATDTRVRSPQWESWTYDELTSRRRRHLSHASQWLREALKSSPGDLEVQLHLGRVQMLLERTDEALRILAAPSTAPIRSTAYLALLFTGAIHERNRRFDDAIAAYGRARELLPSAQSGHVAVSEALHAAGRIAEARAAAAAWLHDPAPRGVDPWLTYYDAPSGAADLKALRARVRT